MRLGALSRRGQAIRWVFIYLQEGPGLLEHGSLRRGNGQAVHELQGMSFTSPFRCHAQAVNLPCR